MRRLDKPIQFIYRCGYPLALWYCRLTKCSSHGVQVALWVKDSVLLVKNSYRPGFSLPGGDVRRGEESSRAACRELAEETGIRLTSEQLSLAMDIRDDSQGLKFHNEIFESRAQALPVVEIDNREVIEAGFFSPEQAFDLLLSKSARWYLKKTIGEAAFPERLPRQ